MLPLLNVTIACVTQLKEVVQIGFYNVATTTLADAKKKISLYFSKKV